MGEKDCGFGNKIYNMEVSMKYLILAALALSCTKQKLECHEVLMTRFDSRTSTVDTTLNKVLCGNELLFLKKDGTVEGYYTYHLIIKK